MADAHRLSELMKKERVHVSGYTIARFWGILSPERKHYRNTLDAFALYLGHKSFDDFILRNQEFVTDQTPILLPEHRYILNSVQMALLANDLETLFRILDNSSMSEYDHVTYLIALNLGLYTRQQSNPIQTISAFNRNPLTRKLFFEHFVDENNAGSYFSGALQELYLPTIPEDTAKQIFALSYLIASASYSQRSIDSALIRKSKLMLRAEQPIFYHEISRYAELKGLLNLSKNADISALYRYLDFLTETAWLYPVHERVWLLYRGMRPVYFYELRSAIDYHPEFSRVMTETGEQLPEYHANSASKFISIEYSRISNLKKVPQDLTTYRLENESNQIELLNVIHLCATQPPAKQKQLISALSNAAHKSGMNWMQSFIRNTVD